MRPIREATLYDLDTAATQRLADEIRERLGLIVSSAQDVGGATRDADIIVTATPSRRAFIGAQHVRAGSFIAAVGSDNPDKQEIEPALLAQAMVVVDDLEQCATMGELHHAIAAGVIDRSCVAGTLGDAVRSPEDFAWQPDRVALFDSTGIPLEDVAAAEIVLSRVRA